MVVIFCQITAEISSAYLEQFPEQVDTKELLVRVSNDVGVVISSHTHSNGETFFLQGDWLGISRARDMLAGAVTVYGTTTATHCESVGKAMRGSGSLSALIEAAEAIISSDLGESRNTEPSTADVKTSEKETEESSCDLENASSLSHNGNEKRFINEVSDTVELITDSVSSLVKTELATNQTQNYSVSSKNAETVGEQYKDDINITSNHGLSKQVEGSDIFVKCDICEKIFQNIYYLNRHKKIHNSAYYTCSNCEKHYKTQKGLEEHSKTHKTDYVNTKHTFKCEQCPKVFSSNYLLDCHEKSNHLNSKKSFICQTCGKVFTTKHTLEEHKNIHAGLKPYQCSECGKCFAYAAALRDHKFIHKESKLFVCQFEGCQKQFQQKSVLRMHENIHLKPNRFECSECGRGFTQRQALQRHVRAHNDLRPFKCKLCGRLFGDTAVIRRHLKLVHKLVKDVNTWKEDITEIDPYQLENNSEKEMEDNEKSAMDLSSTEESNNEKDLRCLQKEDSNIKAVTQPAQNTNSVTVNQINSDSVQNMFLNYNLTNNSVALASNNYGNNTASVIEFSYTNQSLKESATEIQMNSDTVETNDVESEQGSSKLGGHDDVQESALEHGSYDNDEDEFMEKEQIHFFTENLDGTFNTTVDFSKFRRSLDLLSKPTGSLDFSLSSDQPNETLKPDGTEAEIPISDGLEGIGRYGDMEPLAENLGLSHLQYFNSSMLNQSLSEYQSQVGSNLSSADATASDKNN